jgi:hypothetical protein
MPVTKLGRWSIWLSLGFGASFLLFMIAAVISGVLGMDGGDKPTDNLFLFIPITLAAITGNASFITALVSVIFHKESHLYGDQFYLEQL